MQYLTSVSLFYMKRLFFVFIDVVIAGNDIDRCDAVTVFQSLEDDALAGSCLLAGDLAGLCLDGDALFGYTDEFIIVISGYERRLRTPS